MNADEGLKKKNTVWEQFEVGFILNQAFVMQSALFWKFEHFWKL